MATNDQYIGQNNKTIAWTQRVIPLFVGLSCLAQMGRAQDTITVSEAKVIKARSVTIIDRYFKNLLNTISYTGVDNADVKELISQSFEDNDKQLFLNNQIAVADDITDPDYSGYSNAPDVTVTQYLNAFNTFYEKSDSNSVYFSEIRTSPVKKGRNNMYLNIYFTSFFKNRCLSKPADLYRPARRVAEIFVKRAAGNKWLLYISRIGFLNPADSLSDLSDNIILTEDKKQDNPGLVSDETKESEEQVTRYADQARLEEKKRNYASAINLYRTAIDLAPEKGSMYEARIKELNAAFRALADLEEKYRAGLYKAAIQGYTELLQKPKLNSDHFNSDYYLGRAKCYDKMGQLTKSYNEQVKNYDAALKDYARSYEYDNDNMETIRSRADLYRRMNLNVEALREYRTYLAKDPTDPSIYQAIANLHQQIGDLEQAIKDSDAGLSQGKMDPVSKSKLFIEQGVLYAQKKEYTNADDYFTRAIALDSNNAFSYYNRGMTRIKMSRIQPAADDLAASRQKGFGSTNVAKIDSAAQILFERGSYHLNLGNYDSALLFIDAAIQVNPAKSYYYFARGDCYFSKNNFPEAIKAYSLAIGQAGNYSNAFYKRGLSYAKLGKFNEAIADFTHALQYDPQSYLAKKGIGDAYFDLNDYKNCVVNLEACLAMASLREAHTPKTTAEIYNTIGKAYFRMKGYPKALENYRRFLAFHPTDMPPSFNYEMGNIYLNTGKYDSANSYLVRAVRTDPLNGHVLYSMASCFYLRGKTEESLKWFERSFKTKALEKSFVDQDALLGPLQNDKRFKDLKKKYL